jgi:hypothetical protein
MKPGVAIAILWIPAALAQAPASPASQSPVFRTQSTLVVVPAMVRTRSGQLVYTLTAKDFTMKDDGIEQKLTLEEDTGSEPLALVVAVETGGAGGERLDEYRNLASMIENIAGSVEHRVAVVAFDSGPRLLQDFTSDPAVTATDLSNLPAGDRGAAILDGLAFSVDLLRKQPPEYRRAILLISETIDHGSHTQLDDALRAISDTNTAIYSLGFSSSKTEAKSETLKLGLPGLPPPGPGPAGGCFSRDPNADPATAESRATQNFDCFAELLPPLRLAKMAAIAGMNSLRRNVPESVAQLTGGEFFAFKDAHSLERGLQTISNHVPNRYVLSFQPQSPHPGFHSVELRLKDYPNLVVTARNGYWAESQTAAGHQP